MKEPITLINFYSVEIPHKAGAAARVLTALREAKINLTAVWGYPTGEETARLDIVPVDATAFVAVLRKLKIPAGAKRTAFFFSGKDHPGVLAEAMERLGAAGVNVHAAQAVCSGSGKFGAMIQVSAADLRAAKRTLDVK